MPHNQTRLWIGLAIAAITIPAVGTFYTRSTTSDVTASPIQATGRPSVVGLRGSTSYSEPPVAQFASRDYLAEVRTATGDGSSSVQSDVSGWDELDDGWSDIPFFLDYDPSQVEPPREAPPDPVTLMAPEPSAPVAYTNDGPVAANGSDIENSLPTDAVGAPILSNAVVLRVVINNLSGQEREEFVRAYAAMSPDQRADLLDEFRAEMGNEVP